MKDDEQFGSVIENSHRLLNESELLLEHGRCASAFALAVLGLEEVGKAILLSWLKGDDTSKLSQSLTFHIRKQSAVAHLLSARLAVEHIIEEIVIPNIPELMNGTFAKDNYVEGLAKKMWESDEGRWSRHTEIGVFDILKQISIYDDGSRYKLEVRSTEVGAGSVIELVENARRAVRLLDHELSMKVAKATFDISVRRNA